MFYGPELQRYYESDPDWLAWHWWLCKELLSELTSRPSSVPSPRGPPGGTAGTPNPLPPTLLPPPLLQLRNKKCKTDIYEELNGPCLEFADMQPALPCWTRSAVCARVREHFACLHHLIWSITNTQIQFKIYTNAFLYLYKYISIYRQIHVDVCRRRMYTNSSHASTT